MEKKRNQQPPRHKNSNTNLLDYLPRAVSSMTVNFPNPTFTPDREKKYNSNSISTGFSGPMLIPEEIRRKPRKCSSRGYSDEKEEEPNSPKVSCIGNFQKHNTCNTTISNDKKKRTTSPSKVLMIKAIPSSLPPSRSDNFRFHRRGEVPVPEKEENYITTPSKKPIFKLFSKLLGRPKETTTKQVSDEASSVPSLGQMKRFVSGRHSLDGFDWTTQITPVEEEKLVSDEDRPPLSEEEEDKDEDEDDDRTIPLRVGRGGDEDRLVFEPRNKEVN